MPTIKDIAPESVFTIELNAGTPGRQGPKGEQGIQGIQGPRGETGPKPIRGIDYFTQQDISNMVTTVTGNSNSAFNENVANKTKEFNANVSAKTSAFDNNAVLKTEEFNANANSKKTDFNLNANNKTTEFNTNASNKKNEIDTHETNKTTEFDNHVVEKIKEFKEETSEYVTETELESKGYLVESDLNGYAKEKDLFSGSYNDLKDKPKIPNKTSELTNDKGFINEIPSEYVTEEEQNEFIKPYNERITENEKYISDLEATIDILTNTNKAKGELVHITDALPLPTFENKVDGNVEQFTTTGNQLLDINTVTPTDATISDGIITSKTLGNWGTITWKFPNIPLSRTIYYVSFDLRIKSGTCKYLNKLNMWESDIFVQSYDFIVNPTPSNIYQRYCIKFDLTNNTTLYNLNMINIQVGDIVVDAVIEIKDIMLSTSSDYTYEKFTNGASPNPDYQQPIEVLEAYNLLYNNIETQTINGLEVTKNKDGSTTINGTATQDTTLYISHSSTKEKLSLDADDYYINGCPSGGGASTYRIMLYDKSWGYISQDVGNGANFTINEYKEICIATINIIKGATLNNLVFKPQIVKGKVSKPYLPYGCVGYKVNGKNLLNLNTTPIYVSGASSTFNEPNITITKTSPSLNASCVFIVGDANILNGKTLKYTGELLSGTGRAIIGYADTDGTNRVTITGNTNINSGTFERTITVDGTTYANKKVVVWLYSDVLTTGNIGDEIIYKNVMVSENGGEYEPYKEQIVPLDLKGNWVGAINNDIKDYLVTDKKKYWLVKNVGKYVFNGSEAWFAIGENGLYRIATGDLKGIKKPNTNMVCSHFICDVSYNRLFDDGIMTNTPSGDISVFDTEMQTADELKAYLKEQYDKGTPITLVYELAEPYTEDLGELPEPIKTFEGVNNIQLLANLDTEIEVTYALDVKKYFENKLAEISAQII